MIEIESGSIIKTVDKRLKSTNRKAKEKDDIERQKTIIRRGTVKEMIEKMERQNNSTLKIANKEISSNNMGKRLYDR